jgi:DivIVA domain-containing protein
VNRFPRVPAVVPGYDPDEVDALIKRIEATLGKGVLEDEPVTADEIRAARFRVRLGGYNEMAVDYALEAFIIAVENKDVPPRRAGEAAATEQAPGRNGIPDHAPAAPRDATPPEQPPPEPAAASRAGAVTTSGPEARAVPDGGAARRATGTASPPWPTMPEDAIPRNGAAGGPPWPTKPLPRPEPAEAAAQDGGDGTAEPEEPAQAAAASGPAPAAGAAAADEPDGPGEEWFEEQARRVEQVSFRSGRLGMGYSEEEVDAFLDRIVATLRRTTDEPLTADDVRQVRFSTVLFRPGYAIGEVDEFLAEIAEVIARR